MSNETLPHVIADLRDRAEVGFKKYGHGVEASSDDMMQHAYEEALDLAMYLKTEINRKREAQQKARFTTVDFKRDDFNRRDLFTVNYLDGAKEEFSIQDSFKNAEGAGKILALHMENVLRRSLELEYEKEFNKTLPLSLGDYT